MNKIPRVFIEKDEEIRMIIQQGISLNDILNVLRDTFNVSSVLDKETNKMIMLVEGKIQLEVKEE